MVESYRIAKYETAHHNFSRFFAIFGALKYGRHMPRRAQWIVAVFLYCVGALFVLASCTHRNPELIAVSRVSPDRVAERDLLTITGEGFVVGAEARIEFSGTVYRAGVELHKVNIEHRGVAVDSDSIELQVTSDLARRFCEGPGELRASHATFRGELRVSFVPRLQGAPPIQGKARTVVLDVFVTRDAPDTRTGVPAVPTPRSPILEFLGLTVEELGEMGLRVQAVVPDKPAADAGLRVNDVITAWNNVRVHRVEDLEPFPGQRLVDARLERAEVATDVSLVVPVEGYAPRSASGWWAGVVLIGLLVITLFLSRTRVSEWLVWLTWNVPRNGETAGRRQWAIGPFLVVSAIFAVLAMQRRLLPDQLDLVWVMVVVSGLTALSGMAAARRKQHFSLISLAGVSLRQVPLHLCWWLGVLVIVLEYGRTSVWELSRSQTVDPRSFGAFASPTSFACAAALLVASGCLTLAHYGADETGERPFWKLLGRASRSAGDVAALLVGGLAIAVYFGGWSFGWESPKTFGVAAALSFQARFTAFYFGFLVARRWLPAAPGRVVESFALKRVIPIVVLGMVLLPVWSAEVWPAWLRSGIQTLLLGLGVLVVVGVPAILLGIRRLTASRLRTSGLNPWI
jgi:hypothetical protein